MSSVVNVSVLGINRKVHIEKEMSSGLYAARTYVKGKTVSGTLQRNSRGALRFTPQGVNASLVRS